MTPTEQALPTRCDVAIIGAGAGGLTAGALLARAGLRCVVLEAESQPGGYLAGFRRQGFTFNSSIEWLNQCGPGGFVRRVFEALGDAPPDCPPLRRIRRFKGDGFDYLLTSDPDVLRDELVRDFPEAADGIRAFFRDARRLVGRLAELDRRIVGAETLGPLGRAARGLRMLRWALPFLRHVRTPIETGLRRYFGTSPVQRIFNSPESWMSVMVSVGWAYQGNYQSCPAGGSQAIADWLCRCVESSGSTVLTGRRVDRVLLDGDGHAAGVRLADGGEVAARHVIAACDLQALYERMLPPGTIPEPLRQAVAQADLFQSYCSVFLGLDCSPADLGFGEEALHLTRGDVERAEHSSGDPRRSMITVLAPSLRDPTMAPPGKGTLTLHFPARLEDQANWQTGPGLQRGADYRALKRATAEILLDRVEAAVAPGLRGHVEFLDVSTPVTYWRYTGNAGGTIMGAKPTGRNIRAKVAHLRTPVPGLLVGGHCAEYGGGVPLAVKAGANAALVVLQERAPDAYARLKALLEGR
jgi:phytoene dehydrogenase-like protein